MSSPYMIESKIHREIQRGPLCIPHGCMGTLATGLPSTVQCEQDSLRMKSAGLSGGDHERFGPRRRRRPPPPSASSRLARSSREER